MGMSLALLFLQLVYFSSCMDQVHITYEWKLLDYQYPSPEERQWAVGNHTFTPENNVPVGLETYEDKLFITVPRLRPGVPSSLNYVDLKDKSSSPVLQPYPNWEAHTFGAGGEAPEVVSPFRIRADRCSRLWVLDSGIYHDQDDNITQYPPKIIVYDLKNNSVVRKYIIPKDQLKKDTELVNIAVEVIDCNNTFVYAVDSSSAALVVYSWAKNDSWRITHHHFNIDPMAGKFNIRGYNYTAEDALYGIGLSAPKGNFSTMYFHPLTSNNEFVVSTEYLRNSSIATDNFNASKLLGSRGTNAQSSISFLDPKTGVLFYSLVNLNAVACWSTSNKEYLMKNQGRIYMNNETMVNPSDIKVDYNSTLWILSNKLRLFEFKKLNTSEVNFRVFSAPVVEAISHTACDITPRTDILEKTKNMANTLLAETKNVGNTFLNATDIVAKTQDAGNTIVSAVTSLVSGAVPRSVSFALLVLICANFIIHLRN